MSSQRKSYRVYGYDAANRSLAAEWIKAASDAEAIATIQAAGFNKCEVWDGRRLVAQLEDERRQA
jgi:hypothetical protein